MTVSISPLHLALPFLETTAEFRFNEAVSLALIGGAGTVEVTGGDKVFVYEVGMQSRYYYDDFEGGNIGFEGILVKASLEDGQSISSSANGFAVGPFAGWKFVLDSGLTFDLQAGYQFLVNSAEATDEDLDYTVTDSESSGIALAISMWGGRFNVSC